MKKPKLFQKISPKWLISGAIVAALFSVGGFHFLQSKPQKLNLNGIEYTTKDLKSAKLKNFFYKVQKNPAEQQEYLQTLGSLTPEELDQGYQTAVKTFQYDLAIEFYEQGAQNCYEPGQDILLVAINTGRLNLIHDLLSSNYPIELYHLNAARALVNIDQANWAYIFNQQDTDDLAYQRYLIDSQKLASQVISLYKKQNPVSSVAFESQPTHQENYQVLHGDRSVANFHEHLQNVLNSEFTIESAVHGTQHTPIIVDREGQKVGIIKTKNELLAHALDYDHFAGVPPAVEAFVPKYGKVVVQKWVPDTKMASECRYQKESNSEQLHHVRVLDIRLGNSDRNKANLLITEKNNQQLIVPIDHDLIHHYIPNDTDWEAAYLNAPFSPLSKNYISAIDVEKDAQVMQYLGFNNEEVKMMKIRTTLLKMAAERNLTLKETDMLFRYYYYDFLEGTDQITAQSTEEQIKANYAQKMDHVSSIVQNPVEVWGLMGNSFELYI